MNTIKTQSRNEEEHEMSQEATRYPSVMLDLETMGNGPRAAIVAIGAVAFDVARAAIGPRFYRRVSLESSVACGGVMDASRVLWWMKQSEAARAEITRPDDEHLNGALIDFSGWIKTHTEESVEIWGNGASFDNVILRSAYTNAFTAAPWAWWNDRCYRTVKAQHRHIQLERLGTHHNALDDATSQAAHLIRMLRPEYAAEPASVFFEGETWREGA